MAILNPPIVDPRIPLEQPDHPVTHPIIHTEPGTATNDKVSGGGDKNQIVAYAHFVRVIRLSVKGSKVALRFFIFDRRFHHRYHRRQYFKPVPMKTEGRNQKDDDHQRTNGCLNADGDAKAAHDH